MMSNFNSEILRDATIAVTFHSTITFI